jgi:hypothetical protein
VTQRLTISLPIPGGAAIDRSWSFRAQHHFHPDQPPASAKCRNVDSSVIERPHSSGLIKSGGRLVSDVDCQFETSNVRLREAYRVSEHGTP